MEEFKTMLREIVKNAKVEKNSWFYNAGDEDLRLALEWINACTGDEGIGVEFLRIYREFIRHLLNGELLNPPVIRRRQQLSIGKFANSMLACDILVKVVKCGEIRRIREIVKMFIVVMISDGDIDGVIREKFRRKVDGLVEVFQARFEEKLRQAFYCLIRQIKDVNMKRQSILYNNGNDIMSVCCWRIVGVCKTHNDQLAFWKWKLKLPRFSTKLHQFYSINSKALSLLKYLAVASNLWYTIEKQSVFNIWKHQSFIYKLKIMKLSLKVNSTENIIKLISNSLYLPLSDAFSALKHAKFRKAQKPPSYLNPYLCNISHIIKASQKKALFIWKKHSKKPILVSKKHYKFLVKPQISIEYLKKSKIEFRMKIKNSLNSLQRSIRKYWKIWKFEKKIAFDINLSTAETTIDLSNFVLSTDKGEKLRSVITEVIRVQKARKGLPVLSIGKWIQVACKKSLTVAKLKVIMNDQIKKKEAMKHGFSELALICRYQAAFTDMN